MASQANIVGSYRWRNINNISNSINNAPWLVSSEVFMAYLSGKVM
jgi:hypothetical protein